MSRRRISGAELAEELRAWFVERFERLETLAGAFTELLACNASGHLQLNDSTRRKLKAVAEEFLAENETVDGCGLIFAHSALGTENGALEWWVREDESRFARYSIGVVPGADRYYDYEHHEWFFRAFNDGLPALVGPYIDYLGVEAYVVTLTVPAVLEAKRVGAIGNDIQVSDLGAALLPLLQSCESDAVLLGSHDNVLISNTSRLLPGEFFAPSGTDWASTPLSPASTGLRLVHRT
ncbi:PDC sensor domain-containing protein [Leucobacter weissii]|uniref:PDC sensor domain-containing protein n=1 Tax=Leucobacter weissii TaxID=1983706 RepID=A0A939MKZ3_9MICO|nr:cache domain-containing protein [Leucobacter weissii]MBO1902150.1 PDC sensor domain-containing protein [Leucobacter weissii]